jgi:hypothetical protein
MLCLSKNLDLNKCWYYRNKKGSSFRQSFNERLKKILPQAKSHQKIVLRDYEVSFGAPSKVLHPNPHINETNLTLKSLEHAITRASLLIMQVLTEIVDLIDEQSPEGILKRISDLTKNNKFPEELLNKTLINPDIKINDLVLVYGCFLAQVIGEKVGEYDYKTYSIKYIEKPSLIGIGMDGIEDECPASYLSLFYSHVDISPKV